MAERGPQPLKASEYWRLLDRIGEPGRAARLRSSDLVGSSTSSTRARRPGDALLGPGHVDRLRARTARPVGHRHPHRRSTPSYPQRWSIGSGPRRRPLLHAAGTLELLSRPGLGIVGSRDVSDVGAGTAGAAGEVAARRGLAVVSGGARGVGQRAVQAAIASGGSAVGFVADSLVRTLKGPDVRRAVHRGSTVLCTPYGPDIPFTAGAALGRNRLIYAQSRVTLVVASDLERGGTWAGANEAVVGGMNTVAVWRGVGEGPGNAALEQRGAIPVTSMVDLETLLDSIGPEPGPPPPPPPMSLPDADRCYIPYRDRTQQDGDIVLLDGLDGEVGGGGEEPLPEVVRPEDHDDATLADQAVIPWPSTPPGTRVGVGRRGSRCGRAGTTLTGRSGGTPPRGRCCRRGRRGAGPRPRPSPASRARPRPSAPGDPRRCRPGPPPPTSRRRSCAGPRAPGQPLPPPSGPDRPSPGGPTAAAR